MKKSLPERFRRSFGFRLFLAYAVFVFIISVSFTAFFIHHQRRSLTEKMVKSGHLLAEILAYNCRLGVFSESQSLLEIPVEGMIRQESVLSVWVYNQDGRLLKSQVLPVIAARQTGKLTQAEAEELFRKMRLSKSPLSVDRDDEFEFWSPVMSGSASTTVESLYFDRLKIGERDRVIGFVGLALEKDRLRRKLQEQLFTSLGIGLLFLLASCVITFFLTRKITRPLYRLNHSVTLLGEKGRVEEVPVETADEIGELASAFNVMADSLQKRENALRESQAQAMQANRLAGLGELAAGVAHEINNPINGIINYAQILSDAAEDGKEESEIPNRIIREGERIANIVQSLLSFARGSPREKQPIHIREILEDSLILVESHLEKGDIHLEVEVPEDLPQVFANGQQIQQVFLNVISNARYALSQRFPKDSPDKRMRIEAGLFSRNGRQMVRTIFLDHGSGIPENLLGRICDPFFSTKPPGVGTGLGLSISLGIIEDHCGALSFESREGEFTRVIIDLPACGETGNSKLETGNVQLPTQNVEH